MAVPTSNTILIRFLTVQVSSNDAPASCLSCSNDGLLMPNWSRASTTKEQQNGAAVGTPVHTELLSLILTKITCF
ncbi:Hypothetical protein SMAX5B_021321 [Scophthalmus maximus]|uniref:Uncharacterized protein n=1 Tax=Scophthalmus maximus TaxID=52904 RepID=A0A2U9BNG8_SCOMX|nr:Hypothetical protein SMAX5B_021321 [Scophthalmus maximus]